MEADVVIEAARFIAEHAGEPLALADVADHVSYSPFHLARTFERRVGMPPGRFLAAHRFQLAKRLLLEGDARVVDVCHAAGFRAPGTFAARFTAFVGVSPSCFRLLPDLLSDAPPGPVVVDGRARGGGTVIGRVSLTPMAAALVAEAAQVYVGLFPLRAARGLPVSGALIEGATEFRLGGVPDGTYWLLASALPARAAFDEQLVPERTVAGSDPRPVRICAGTPVHRRDLLLAVQPAWAPPVQVALPPLASRARPGGAKFARLEMAAGSPDRTLTR